MARIFQTTVMGEAHFRVAIVDHPGQADLAVYRVSSWGEAHGDGLWYITRHKQDANLWLYFGSIGIAQFKVCFVSDRGQAGWLTRHHCRATFSRLG
ncbi:DUF6150 family protein [Gynuella sp.]|uniref:DUF6150 family protein n=1 Tax=Gynuella sp. TaxID=2969146 RepID=UPI003D149108